MIQPTKTPEIVHTARMDSKDGGKSYFVDFKKNHRGGYVVIVERVNGNRRHNVVVISEDLFPRLSEILAEGKAALDRKQTTPKTTIPTT